jgi:hypothetical protein
MYASDLNCNLTQEIEERIKYASAYNQMRIGNATVDTQLRAGDTSVYGRLFPSLPAEMRNCIPINRIKSDCESISGMQRNNQKQPVFKHRNQQYEETSELLSKLVQASMQYGDEDTQHTFSTSFDCAVTTGMGLIQVLADWSLDPICGDLRTSYIPSDQFYIDPDWQGSPKLTDLEYIHPYRFIGCKAAAALYPDHKKALLRSPNRNLMIKHRVNNPNTVSIEEHWYIDHIEQENIIDTESGIYFTFTGDEKEKNRLLKLGRGTLQPYTSTVRAARRALAINGCWVDDDWSPLNTNDLPFAANVGYFYSDLDTSNSVRLQGLVRGMAAMQFVYSQHMTLNLWSVQKSVFPRWVVDEDAVVNMDDLDDPTSTRNIKLNSKAIGQRELHLLEANNIIVNNSALLDQLRQDMTNYSSINQEMTGMSSADISTALANARQGAGINSLQTIFSNADQAMCQIGRIFSNFHKANTLPYKVRQITGMEPTDSFYLGIFPEYNIVVEQGLLTESQREREATILLQLMDKGFKGISPDEVIDLLNLTNGVRIKQQMAEAAQAEEQAAAQATEQELQLKMPKEEAQANYFNAAAEASMATAQERISRIMENQGLAQKNFATAIAEQEKALLDHVKAIAQIEEIDLQNKERYLNIADRISKSLTPVQRPIDTFRNVNTSEAVR